MTETRVLFPISVDSKRFTSNETIAAINEIQGQPDEIIFFIADGLQLYNKATRIDKGESLSNIIDNFRLKNDYYIEKEKWLQKIRPKCLSDKANSKWTFTHIFEVSDNHLHSIYRSVFISFLAIDSFRKDIEDTAKKHRSKYSTINSQYSVNLSIAYILEEIALNLRIRVPDKIYYEYYLGELPVPLINLYNNKYEIDVFTLCGVPKSDLKFHFYHSPYLGTASPIWEMP